VSTSGGMYNENTSVSITASPAQGYEFSSWTGTSLTGNSISVKVTSNQTIIANFVRSKYTLTVDTVGSGQVAQQVVNSARETTEYESGNTIRLTASPQSDFLFYDWEYLLNDVSENTYENPLELIMDQSKTVTATFEEKLPLINPENTDKNNTIGKWKIRKKRPGSQSSTSARAVECQVNEIIFRTDNSFTIITETSTITGQYSIDSENSISLNQGETNIGRLTDIILTQNYFSFNIELTGVCNEKLEADRDPIYDEVTDPIAPSNTESSTISSRSCTIETELTSDNINQTISVGDSIQDILIAVTVGSTCTETLSVSSSNLPEGVLVSLDNNQITISGTPSSNSVGTFNYDIMLSVASPTIIVSGQIIVEQVVSQTNQNEGGGVNNTSGTNTSTTTSGTTARNCQLEFTFTATDGAMTVSETISKDARYFSTGIRYADNSGSDSENCQTNLDFFNDVQVDVNGLPSGLFADWDPSTQTIVVFGTPESSSLGTHDIEMIATYGSQSISHRFKLTVETRTSTNTGTTTSTTSSNTFSAETYTINVTASNFNDYNLSGFDRNGNVSGADPSVTVRVGDTLNFAVNATQHPFYLKTVQETGTDNLISGATGNGATIGTVSWIPTAAGTYYYQCSIHNAMYGTITVN
ncbi:MAG: putative Ig domain-containing protein, partial [Gammaproteobacteria bacterium]